MSNRKNKKMNKKLEQVEIEGLYSVMVQGRAALPVFASDLVSAAQKIALSHDSRATQVRETCRVVQNGVEAFEFELLGLGYFSTLTISISPVIALDAS